MFIKMVNSKKLEALIVIILQIALLVIFVIFSEYKIKEPDEAKYPKLMVLFLFTILCDYDSLADASLEMNSLHPTFDDFKHDVHVMIFVGFGFLMTFLKRYGFSAVGFNFLLASITVQWALICQGFYELNENNKIEIGIRSLIDADITAAAILISMGAVLGRTSYIQLILMSFVEVPILTVNSYLGTHIFKVTDAGDSIFIHVFGAYFGLAVSYMISRNDKLSEYPLESSNYTSDLFAMIGTIFLWLFWPSFNGIGLSSHHQHRALVNTYLSLSASCITAFTFSQLMTKEHKLDMVHIQNATLAGGVAMGTAANLMVHPYGALAIGMVAGSLSVYGYAKIGPWLFNKLHIKDTCGVNNLHGMPGIFAGLIGALMAAIANEDIYDKSLYEIFPAMAGKNVTPTAEFVFLQSGDERTASQQASFQLLALIITFIMSVTCGLLTGFIMNFAYRISVEVYHSDAPFWHIPQEGTSSQNNSVVETITQNVVEPIYLVEHI